MPASPPTPADYVRGILAGNRAMLARAITLIESRHPAHEAKAQAVLQGTLPHAGGAIRVGISGVPGAGKSTFIEALGGLLTSRGHKVAVLAIDPSSAVTHGSILGDKTRMQTLSAHPDAFIRPSPTSGSLGGVARRTLETLTLCEAAGFDVVLVETVGVGQSEVLASQMVDTFLVLLITGAGDELQGIKRGILEIADLITLTKADGDNVLPAQKTARGYRSALQFMRPVDQAWKTEVHCVSALTGDGVSELWDRVLAHRAALEATGSLARKRSQQQLGWMWRMVEDRLQEMLRRNPAVAGMLPTLERSVIDGRQTPGSAAEAILKEFMA